MSLASVLRNLETEGKLSTEDIYTEDRVESRNWKVKKEKGKVKD